MNSDLIVISPREIAESLDLLRRVRTSECVLLWLGHKRPEKLAARVTEVYRPQQIASSDYFEIPRSSMASLFKHLRANGLAVLAQIHTHPRQAFHSQADDRWAIIRHVGALSLVLPYFAQSTTLETFWRDVAIFRLNADNQWLEVEPQLRDSVLREEN